jgi:tetratricopeptide (TPR) repeat protein
MSEQQLHALLSEASGLLNEQRYTKARKICEQALAIAPDSADARMLLAGALEGRGDIRGAVQQYAKAIESDPKHIHSWVNLGVCQKQSGNLMGAIEAFEGAAKIDPDSPQVAYNLARALADAQRFAAAADAYATVVRLQPGQPETQYALGNILQVLGRFDESTGPLRKAIELKPDYADAHCALGQSLLLLGETSPGQQSLTRAMELDPDHCQAAYILAGSEQTDAQARDELTRLEHLFDSQSLSNEARTYAHFAAARLHDKLGNHAKAFEHCDYANRYRHTEQTFDIDDHSRLCRATAEVFSGDFLRAERRRETTSSQPAFVVGMPQSGVALVQRIISAHPEAANSGAPKILQDIQLGLGLEDPELGYPHAVPNLSDARLDEIAQLYLSSYAEDARGAERVVDAVVGNEDRLGIMALLFRSAPIIHCTRDPMDMFWSSLFSRFGRDVAPYTYNMDNYVAVLGNRNRLMEHWNKELPGAILTVDYDELVTDLETQARRIIEFVGLEWDAACIEGLGPDVSELTVEMWRLPDALLDAAPGCWKAYAIHFPQPEGMAGG